MTESRHTAHAPAVILFGSPGSGKGTQADLIQKRFGWPHISTGDMLRQHIALADRIGLQVEQLMRSGKLVSDELVNDIVRQRLANADCASGVILDGYPRTVGQAAVLLGIVEQYKLRPAVVHLVVDYNRIVARLSGRRQCPVCGTLYSIKTHPPLVAGICDLDGAALVTRDDDREEVIRERLEQYDLQTRPLLAYFREAGLPMIETQGASRQPEDIMRGICDALHAAGLLSADAVPGENVAL